jgi:hexosaminidase
MKRLMNGGLLLMLLMTAACYGDTMPSIIPQPVDIQPQEGFFELTPETAIITDPSSQHRGEYLADTLAPAMGFRLSVRQQPVGDKPYIILKQNNALKDIGDEGYHLTIQKDNVTIQAKTQHGLFYGIMTLKQLLPPEIFSETKVGGVQWKVPCVTITDTPRFQWRGMHLDVCRHFMPREFVKKYINLIALHKMNVFHWHLTEDQGWRIEIKQYPKLTGVGARRAETIVGHARGPRDSWTFDGTPHGGYYTQDDIREIVAYAKERFVTVVPEIEMPGHSQAAIAAYPELGNYNQKLDVCTWWGYGADVFNVEESTITFLQNVLTEVMDLFDSEYIHIGGDEVPKHHWKNSQRAQARMKELGLQPEEELQSWFIQRMDAFLTEHGRRLVGWDEILEGGLAPGAVVMSWRGTAGGIAAAEAGHDVIMAPSTHLYFDHYQSPPEGQPLAIGGFTPLEKVYGFEPIPDELTAEQAKHVLGAQGQVWTEYIKDPNHVETMALPRMCALAEVVWTPADKKDYDNFYERLTEHAERLKMLDVNFFPLKKHQPRTQ